MKNNSIHRGELLKKVVGRSDLSIIQVCKRAGFNRSSYYNHIEIHDLNFNILEKYGKALDYDFSADLPEMKSYNTFGEPGGNWHKSKGLEDITRERDAYRDKYLELLERYNKLIEERLKGE